MCHQVQMQIPATGSNHLCGPAIGFLAYLSEALAGHSPKVFQCVSWSDSLSCFGAKRSQWLIPCGPKVTGGLLLL